MLTLKTWFRKYGLCSVRLGSIWVTDCLQFQFWEVCTGGLYYARLCMVFCLRLVLYLCSSKCIFLKQ